MPFQSASLLQMLSRKSRQELYIYAEHGRFGPTHSKPRGYYKHWVLAIGVLEGIDRTSSGFGLLSYQDMFYRYVIYPKFASAEDSLG